MIRAGRASAERDEEGQAWRDELALRLLRVFCVIFGLSTVVVWITIHGARERLWMTAAAALATFSVAVPAFTGHPRGAARGWMVIVPAAAMSVAGYAFVGFLSGPGVCLALSMMLTGLLLGQRAMIGVTAFCAAAVTAVSWAMVTGRMRAPNPVDSSMTSAFPWIRTLSVTFLAISLFCGLVVTVVARMERSLRLTRQEVLLREQAERDRAEAERVALESRQMELIGRLAAGIAHDFNNNLTAIMGSAELLKMELSEGSSRELADSILRSSGRVAELTHQLLAYSRKAQMLRKPRDLHDLVREAVSLLQRSIDPKVRVVTELEAREPTVVVDATLLQNAVLNLLVNANDAMPDGGTLTVSTRSPEAGSRTGQASLPEGQCVLLEIRDTGHGIAKELIPQIFDPFFTTKALGRGTGLGLAAVAGTIKAHGGTIDVESEIGVGTVFRILLPVSAASVDSASEAAEHIVRGEGELLLVDDDAVVRYTAATVLRSFGYTVIQAPDGQTAIDLVRQDPERFALVLLDLRMPGLSGEATFSALMDISPTVKIVIWSGYAAEQDVGGMIRRGAVGFVQKPYRVAELSRIIADGIARAR